ncbi:MAG: nitrile hydratase subunit alpha [Nitriliruptoraceae bacterium]
MSSHSYAAAPQSHNHDKDATRVALTARTAALEAALVAGGVLQSEQVDELVETYAEKLGPRHGAAMVARAWVDPTFRQRLEEDATSIIRDLGYDLEGSQHRDLPFATLRAVFNTPEVHNVIVCTLCSCYPLFVLGPQPRWYKSPEYRSRMVIEPTQVLKEFGTSVPAGKTIRVWDSNAETRYLVIPERPKGTEAMNEDQLRALVTRDSMIGVTVLPDVV